MVIRRWLVFLGLLSLWAICLSCGQNYRLPIIQIPGDPGDPKLYHFAMTISTNDPVANANVPGTVSRRMWLGHGLWRGSGWTRASLRDVVAHRVRESIYW